MGNSLFINAEKEEHLESIRKLICTCNVEKCNCKAVKLFDCNKNPDILSIEEKIPVADFRNELDIFFQTAPNVSKTKILYLPRIDEFPEILQNVLLKFIEDGNDKVSCIAAASEIDRVLPTVRSRMRIIERQHRLNFDAFKTYCYQKCISNAELYYCLTEGNVAKIPQVEKLENLWLNIAQLMLDRNNMVSVFETLHLIKEKDKEEFTAKNGDLTPVLISLIENLFYKMLKDNSGNWRRDELLRNIHICDDEIYKVRTFPSYKGKELTLFLIKIYEKEVGK